MMRLWVLVLLAGCDCGTRRVVYLDGGTVFDAALPVDAADPVDAQGAKDTGAPTAEECNALDDDVDGARDEETTDECFGERDCSCRGIGCAGFDWEEVHGLDIEADGSLTVGDSPPGGYWVGRFVRPIGCPGNWQNEAVVSFDAPLGVSALSARTADDEVAIEGAAWADLPESSPQTIADARRYVDVRVDLTGEERLVAVSLWSCCLSEF
jgi:hypothetical protein